MRVAFVLGQIARGGTEGQAELLVAALRRRGLEVDVLVVERTNGTTVFAGAPVAHLGIGPRREGALGALLYVLAVFRLAYRLRARRYDVIHSALARGYLAAAFAVPRRHRCRVITWRRNLGIHLQGPIQFRLERFAGRRAGCVVANSSAVAQWWTHSGLIDPGSLVLVPNALEPWRFERVEPAMDREAALTLVAVGNLRHAKGHDLLLAAAGLLVAEGRDVAVAIVGEGACRVALQQQARAAGVRLHLPGSVRDPRPWLEWADVVVHPSRSEGSSNALAEAMAYGRAVVASETGGNPDMLGETGVLVPPGDARALADALRRMAVGPTARGALAAQAQARAGACFDAAAVVQRYVDLYEERARCAA